MVRCTLSGYRNHFMSGIIQCALAVIKISTWCGNIIFKYLGSVLAEQLCTHHNMIARQQLYMCFHNTAQQKQ